MTPHTRQANRYYAAAAVPALMLPASYVLMVAWVFVEILPGILGGDVSGVGKPSDAMHVILWAGFYGTLIQWPFYLAWAALSKELTVRVRIALLPSVGSSLVRHATYS